MMDGRVCMRLDSSVAESRRRAGVLQRALGPCGRRGCCSFSWPAAAVRDPAWFRQAY